jgi:hypothetical protein
MVSTSLQFDDLVAVFEGEDRDLNEPTNSVASVLCTLRDDVPLETMELSIGEAVAVSRKTE